MEKLPLNSSHGPSKAQDRQTYGFGKTIGSVFILSKMEFSSNGAAFDMMDASK